ncbi:filopodin [Heterostelium album PN500]|uniref:Filopodin n=1 Tax=Heterostelium pallidum (strain ATCC 26659 / Pp 5 / PN500) TaxID=670386 RepID=D3BME3_HETP5|nr:filopodin [Heterostelium album PN500]EFA77155.1 filopodin [Heterostelium album PN500]|eukprot:XP_020429284.1 filopodin [Heterostelium album PN500]
MSMSLKINLVGTNTTKTFRFSPEMTVAEVCSQIREKTGEGGEDHGLFQQGIDGKSVSRWLSNEKSLQFYDINADSVLDYKKKHRPQKIKLLDETIKTQLIDESTTVSDIVANIGKKMGIKNPEEYSLLKEGGDWLKNNQILSEQGIQDSDILVLKKKFFFNDANIDRNDPVQLHLLYVQCRDAIIEAKYPTQREEAVQLAALQCQVAMNDFNPAKHVNGYLALKEYLPLQWAKSKNAEKDIYKEYRKVVNMSEVNAKYRYVQLCRSLKTYGMTSFPVKMKPKDGNKKKAVEMTLGITRESMILMVDETKEVIKSHPLKHIRRWAATEKTFTLDFGDHDEEYLVLLTDKPEEISNLIAGYIDIILKSRRDTSKFSDKEEGGIATEESIAIKRGTAATTSTFNYAGPGSGGAYIAPSQQIPITDLKSALRATDLLISELNSMKGVAGGSVPQNFTRSFTTLTPQQYKHQLISHSNAISTAANTLLSEMSTPQPGGMSMTHQAIIKRAQIMMAEMSTVGSCAKNAAYVPELASFSDEIIGVATKLSEAMSKLLSNAVTISDRPLDDAGRAIAQQHVFATSALATMMMAAVDNQYVTESSSQLLVECVKSVASAANLLVNLGNDKCSLVDDDILHSQIENSLTEMSFASDQLLTVTENISTTACHPETRKVLDNLCAASKLKASSILTSFKSSDIPSSDMDGLQVRVQDVMDTLNMVSYALDCVEQRPTNALVSEDGLNLSSDLLTEEFSNLSNDLTNSISLLRNNLNNSPESILESFKVIASNANRLISCTKAVASRADLPTQQRLFTSTNAVFESVSHLSNTCRRLVANIGDAESATAVIDAAGHLNTLTQNMSVDAGKLASIVALRDCSKDMISHVAHLVSTARISSDHLPDASSATLIKASKDVTEAIAKLMVGLKRVNQSDAKSEQAQMELLELSQKQSMPPMNLVSASKRLAPKIADPNHKQRLIYDSDAASSAVQRLMRTCEAYKRICGHAEIEESLEAFDSTMSELETLEIAVQGGFVDTVPGQTRDSTTEMLLVAVKSLNQVNSELVSDVRTQPARLGELVKSATSAANQVAFAAKAVVSTTPGKVAQKKLLATVKQMTIDMQQLVRASRAVATNPGDASSDLLLDGAESDVSSTIASLVAASTHIDCKELDEASVDINNHQAKLGQLGTANPNETFQSHSEEIQSSIKAINAAIAQTVSMARAKNIKGLGASAKILASTVNSLVAVANMASVSCQSEQMQSAILSNTATLCATAITLLDYSKARVANAKDPIYDQNLVHCSKSIEDISNKILRSIGSGSSGICDESIDMIVHATSKLDETIQPEIGDGIIVIGGGQLAMSQQQSLLSLTNAAKTLGKYTSDIVTSSRRANPDHLGECSMSAAKSVVEMIDSARSVIRAAVSSAPPDISIPAKTILDATAIMSASAGQDVQAIIGAARTIASSTTQLFNVSKEKVANEEDEILKAQLVKTTQQVATATSNLAKAVKAVTAKEAGAIQQLDSSIRELESSTVSLLIASSDASDHMKEFERLVGVCRSASSTTAQVIQAAASSSMKPKDSELQTRLNESALNMSSAIKDVLKVSSLMMPGVMLCEEAIDMVQKSIGDLSTMSLSVAVGSSFEAGSANGMSHLECQENMVEITKSIGKGINDLLKASRQSPEAIGQSTRALGFTAPQLANSTKSSLSTTTDQEAQSRIVSESKNLGDSILRLCQASLAASSNPSKETYQTIVSRCHDASEAMNRLVSQISSGVNLYRDLDESIDTVRQSIGRLSEGAANKDDTKSYQDYKEKITTLTKDLAIALKSVIATDPNNLVQVSTIAKDIATFTTQIADNVALVTQTGGDQKVMDSILSNVKQVITSTAQIIDISKQASQGTSSSVAHNDAFKVASDGITRFLQSIKQGAIGEIQCDAAVESIKKMICDIDAYSLFAAAGQLESTTSVANRQHYLRNQVQKDVVTQAKLLIVSGSQLVGSSKGTQENLGAATTKFAEQVTKLVGSSKEVASSLRDTQSQQDVLSASKALSISCQQLVLAGKDAQRFQKDSTAFRSLGKAAEGVAEAVGQLISSVYIAINEAGKGIKELEKASVVINSYIDKPDTVLTNHKATPATYVQSIRDVSKASIDIVTSFQASQEDLVKSSQQLVSSVQAMVGQTKGAVLLFDQQEKNPDAIKLQSLVKEANQSIVALIGQVKEQEEGVSSPLVSEASRKLSEKLHSLVQASKLIPGGKDLVLEEDQQEDLELTAENELNSLAKTIEAATQSLLAARPKTTKKSAGSPMDSSDIAGIIVDASGSIAQAVAKLVQNAAVSQSRRREEQKSQGTYYKQDPTWSNGLISAAKSVGGAVQMMIQAAMKAAQGKAEEEELIATAREVAASTARLVSASRAKSGDDQQSQNAHHQLTLAAKAVTQAISKLLDAAKTATALQEEEEEQESETFNFTGSKIKELEQQMKILRLEKELNLERKRLLNSRKKEYTNNK